MLEKTLASEGSARAPARAPRAAETAGDRCTGHCCHLIPLGFSPAELREAYDRWMRSTRGEQLVGRGWPEDIHLIAPMLVEVAVTSQADAEGETPNGRVKFQVARDDQRVHWYTCRNLLPNGDCGIYAIRPRLCSAYPYQTPCMYGGCTYAAAAAGEVGEPPPTIVTDLEAEARLLAWIRTPTDQALDLIEGPEEWR